MWVENKANEISNGSERLADGRKSPASNIGRHILSSGHVVNRHTAFRVIFSTHNSQLLKYYEAVAIKEERPALCKQKEMVVNLRLPCIVIPLPEGFVTYLHTDGLVLPESSQCGLYTKSTNLAMDGDDDDEDLRDDELMKKYENDWLAPSNTEAAEAPDFGELDETVKTAITSLGGRVFPKLNWSSPKDANWISFNRTLMCTCSSEVYLLLKSSEFIAHDLDQPFIHCDDFDSSSTTVRIPVSYCLVLRKWQSLDPSCEFRCFVHQNKVIGICQRNSTKFYSHIAQEKATILEDIVQFFDNEISSKFPDPNYVFDVVRSRKGKVILLDFNPWGRVTDSLMYTWDELEHLALGSQDSSCQQLLSFRCVESEDGVQSSDYANYAMPKDIRDLAAGEDPFKLMDLMKLKVQTSGDDNSSSDDD